MQWEISGADRNTGDEKTIIIEAENEASAIRRGNRQGMLVASARPLDPNDSAVAVAAPVLASARPKHKIDYEGLPPPRKLSLPLIAIAVGLCVICLLGVLFFTIAGRRANVAGVAAPSVPTAPPSKSITSAIGNFLGSKYSVSGAIWVTHKDGSSEIARGAHIYLLSTTVSPTFLRSQYQAEATEWKQSITRATDDLNQYLQEDAQDHQSQYYTGVWASAIPAKRAILAQKQASLARVQQVAGSISASTDTLNAYSSLASYSETGIPSFSPTENVIADAKASVDGKYEIGSIPSGKYYIFATLVNDVFIAEWLVPVDLSSGDMHLDLDNENAVTIHNFHE